MDLGLSGKKAVVLAASQGLGLGVAERLAQEGVDVLITGRSEDRLRAAAEAINAKSGGRAHFIVADLATSGVATRIVDTARSALGAIDILVNNTGGPPPRAASAVTAQDWSAAIRRDGAAAVRSHAAGDRRHAGAQVGPRHHPRIGGSSADAGLAISNALRLSLVGWMKTLSAEIAADGITVNMIAPGRIATARVRDIDQKAAEKSGRPSPTSCASPFGQLLPAATVTSTRSPPLSRFLPERPASYVTGSIIRVDGGMIRSI